MKNSLKRFHKAVAYIDSLSNLPLFAEYMKPGAKPPHPEIYLKRMRYFLKLLGNPEKDFKFVHIAGTSGKGTVATMVHNALVASGKKSGLFTSPFVVCPIEKIQVGNLYIAPDDFAELVEKIKLAIDLAYRLGEYGRPSHFEIYFAVALLYFKQQKCEWAVLEVGCGGRFDATNVIPAPEVSAITCIDYDHTEILGNTLNKIAYDKAGIIKRGSKFFTAEARPALLKMFERVCKGRGALYESIHATFGILPLEKGALHSDAGGISKSSVSPTRPPSFNKGGIVEGEGFDPNQTLASAISRSISISEAAIKKAITGTRLPARFEAVARNPLVIIDGAHNRSKMAHTVALLKKEKFKKLLLVVAIADNKDSHDILGQIVPLADEIFYTRFASRDRKPAPPARLLEESRRYLKRGAKTRLFLDSEDAFAEARSRARKGDCILITGSFYLAGELRKNWFPESKILKTRRSF